MVLTGGSERHSANRGRDFRTGRIDLLTARFRVRIPTPEPISEYELAVAVKYQLTSLERLYSNRTATHLGSLVGVPISEAGRESVLSGERLLVMPLDLGFRCSVICVRAVETNASCGPGFINVSTQHIPALAQMQHAVMPLCRPTFGRDSDPFFLGHLPHSLSKFPVARSQATHKNASSAQSPLWRSVGRGQPCLCR